MKCSLLAQNVKTLSKAVTTLSKIGNELYMEFLADQLCLRSINSAKSAYGSFVFHRDFFVELHYNLNNERRAGTARDPRARFKFEMRTVIPLFKNSNISDKLESLEIEVDLADSRVIFSFIHKSRVVHRHSLCMMDTDLLQTAYTKRDTRSHVVSSAKLLTETVEHFPSTVEEITFEFKKDRFTVNNYMGDVPDPKQASQMQLIMDIDEFENYEIDRETSITCTLKELKGIVSFTTAFTYNSDVHGVTGLPVKMYFTAPGVPLLLYIESPHQYEASFVIATLIISPKSTPTASQQAVVVPSRSSSMQQQPPPPQPSHPNPIVPGRLESAVSPNNAAPPAAAVVLQELPQQPNHQPTQREPPPPVEVPVVQGVTKKPGSVISSVNGTQKTVSATTRMLFGLDVRPQSKPSQPVAHVILASDTEGEEEENEDDWGRWD